MTLAVVEAVVELVVCSCRGKGFDKTLMLLMVAELETELALDVTLLLLMGASAGGIEVGRLRNASAEGLGMLRTEAFCWRTSAEACSLGFSKAC